MIWFRKLHKWLGVGAGLLMILVTLSGLAVVFEPDYRRLAHPELATPARPLDAAQLDRDYAVMQHLFAPADIRFLGLPTDGMNAYKVYLSDRSLAYVQPQTVRVIDHFGMLSSPMQLLIRFHHDLLMGKTGRLVLGILSCVLLFMMVSGLWIWWPGRKGYRLKHMKPGKTRAQLIRSHRTTGATTVLILLFFAVTGAYFSFHDGFQKVMAALDGEEADMELPRLAPQPGRDALSPGRLYDLARAALPAGQVTFFSPAGKENAAARFRIRLPGELHQNGRSGVVLNPYDGAVMKVVDATRVPAFQRSLQYYFPLHSGRTAGWGIGYRIVVFVAGCSLLLLSLTSILSWVRGRKKKRSGRGAMSMRRTAKTS
ncbi:PepSY-associated TM helix domain-containing protein [Luteithermobacter gelatinilyticus]|uniref:PepSY-associated TM helix domain-containing protein n=1 Tax=Luteithermobacter gelatinilyticus TaxID=2582913 RepID=UPI001106D18A|nr:PepSY-associated TM helix domain-containing protein [Luteithermobacter gelatinilyticus]